MVAMAVHSIPWTDVGRGHRWIEKFSMMKRYIRPLLNSVTRVLPTQGWWLLPLLLVSGAAAATDELSLEEREQGMQCIRNSMDSVAAEGESVALPPAEANTMASRGCRGCHTFDDKQLSSQPAFACKKHSRVMREGHPDCMACHSRDDIEDVYGHNI